MSRNKESCPISRARQNKIEEEGGVDDVQAGELGLGSVSLCGRGVLQHLQPHQDGRNDAQGQGDRSSDGQESLPDGIADAGKCDLDFFREGVRARGGGGCDIPGHLISCVALLGSLCLSLDGPFSAYFLKCSTRPPFL